jgi:UDPglucose 6-dehydrogenase
MQYVLILICFHFFLQYLVSMNLVVIGAGHIGLVTALAFTQAGHDVLCVDTNDTLINQLNEGYTKIYEPFLKESLHQALLKKKIQFTSSYKKSAEFSKYFFLAVSTPSMPDKTADLSSVYSAIENLASLRLNKDTIVIIKSTVPPGTNLKLSAQHKNIQFISNPEFLREGSALHDCLKPDRIIIGTESSILAAEMKEIYNSFFTNNSQFLVMPPNSAELCKYAANTFLAARISLINEFAKVCDCFEADIDLISLAVGLDQRIGPEFLKAGLGYGGSCFPKDLDALIQSAHNKNLRLPLTEAIQQTNFQQIDFFLDPLQRYFSTHSKKEKRLTLWGASFKPQTNDLREAPSIKLIHTLLSDGFTIQCHDPICLIELENEFNHHAQKNKLLYFNDPYEALHNSNALMIATEWTEYEKADLKKMKLALPNGPIFDGRNIFSVQTMKQNHFEYYSIGRPV